MDEPLPASRVSDAEREQTIISLREHLISGRLTLEDFSERVDIALRAGIAKDLARAQENLPQVVNQTTGSRRRSPRFTLALFAHVVRRDRLRLRRRSFVLSVLSDIDLDLREATIDSPRTALIVFAALGNVDVYVPDGVNVEIGGLTFSVIAATGARPRSAGSPHPACHRARLLWNDGPLAGAERCRRQLR